MSVCADAGVESACAEGGAVGCGAGFCIAVAFQHEAERKYLSPYFRVLKSSSSSYSIPCWILSLSISSLNISNNTDWVLSAAVFDDGLSLTPWISGFRCAALLRQNGCDFSFKCCHIYFLLVNSLLSRSEYPPCEHCSCYQVHLSRLAVRQVTCKGRI